MGESYQQVLQGIVDLSAACHDLSAEEWPVNFLSALVSVNLAYLLGQRQPMAWLAGFSAGLNSAVGEWTAQGGGSEASLN